MDVEYEANFLFMVDFGCIWGYMGFLSHLKIRPVTIPILMKDLFLNLFEP